MSAAVFSDVLEGTLGSATTASVESVVGLFRAAKDAIVEQASAESSNPGLSLW